MVRIDSVTRRSAADRAGISAGDFLISVNGYPVNDRLDYDFRMAERTVELVLERAGERYSVTLKKREYADIGLGFSTFLMDGQRSCRNKCIFCFIDQNPPGLRESIYFKDDDTRMSFLSGSYVTLTNLSDADIARIVEMKTSPINISVHTTDGELRVKMLKNPAAARVMEIMHTFAAANITMNCQIVLCRGINDGEALSRTMADLSLFFPQAASVSVVPAGLTKHREGLYPLEPFTPDECAAVIRQVESFAARCLKKHGSRIFFCADEFYVKAGLPLPSAEEYEDFPQLDNGVGKISSMEEEFAAALEKCENCGEGELSVATGTAAYDFIRSLADRVEGKFPKRKIRVYMIENRLFGESVTVAGLICGADLAEQLAGRELGERLLLPEVMLRHEKDMFLDSMTPDELEERLGVPLEFVPDDGYEFVDAVTRKFGD